jgi:hypothetical protein
METTTTHITSTMTPTEIDTIWLDQSWIAAKNFDARQSIRSFIMQAVGLMDRSQRYVSNPIISHPTTGARLIWEDAKAIAEEALANGSQCSNNSCTASRAYLDTESNYNAQAQAAFLIVREADAQWEARQWNRFFLVASSNGHIHSSTNCHTCNKGKSATQFALVPSLSGTSVEEAVATLGAALCSVCFPDAPVEHREQVKVSKAQATILREQGEAAFHQAVAKAAARAAKKAAK